MAGFTGEALEKMLNDYGCYTDFIKLKEGVTRINVKVNAKEETEINGQGPVITNEAIDLCMRSLDPIWRKGMYWCLREAFPIRCPRICMSGSWKDLKAGISGWR